MVRILRDLAACVCIASGLLPAAAQVAATRGHASPQPFLPQETGFLNRKVDSRGTSYHFQVYLPEDFRRDDRKQWPILLFLHGRGERGSEGMWQTQIGLPLEVRDHPDRWPFVIVMPQCPYPNFWTDPGMLEMAMAALDQETAEFHADPARTYLTGLSLGGYGAWELARMYPKKWAAIAIAAGGPFWSYAPERWQQAATLPNEYAKIIGRTPIWLFHGSEDNVVPVRESELMFAAVKAAGGHIRLWVYQGLHHDSWARAYNEPELPKWLLSHHGGGPAPDPPPFAERLVIPLHPVAIDLPISVLDSIVGEYHDANGRLAATLFRKADQLYEKDPHGEITEVEAESPSAFYYPLGNIWTRLIIERDSKGKFKSLLYHDDRHDERWERKPPIPTPAPPPAKPSPTK